MQGHLPGHPYRKSRNRNSASRYAPPNLLNRHFRQRYGANDPAWTKYTDGVQALNAVLTLSWKVTKWASIFASVQQFDIVDDDARDRTKAKKTHNSRRDLTVGTVGVACRF